MPRKYAKKRTPKRRPMARRRRVYRPRVSRRLGVPSGMPATRIARLRWVGDIDITNPDDTTLTILDTYRANDPGNPGTPATHQPMGWDQWAALYKNYTCLGSRITVKMLPSRTYANGTAPVTESSPYAIGLLTNTGSALPTGYTDYTTLIEAKKGTYRITGGTRTSVAIMSFNFSTKKYFNRTDVKDNDDLKGSITQGSPPTTTPPAERADYILWYQSLGGDPPTQNVHGMVIIDYIVMFSDPVNLAPS